MNDSDKATAMSNGDSSTRGVSVEPEYVVPEVLPMDDEGNPTHKIKGAAQIAAGTALTAAGVPMLVLPGPGAVAIAGGAALISKGQRNCLGRSATPFEEKLDDVAEKAAVAVKASAEKTAHKAAEEAPKAAKKVICEAPLVAGTAVAAGSQLTQKGLKYLRNKKSTKKQAR